MKLRMRRSNAWKIRACFWQASPSSVALCLGAAMGCGLIMSGEIIRVLADGDAPA